MSNEQLIIVVLGALAALALGVIAYISQQRKGDVAALAELLKPVLEALAVRADVALAPYGAALRPAHALVEAAGTLIDEPTDYAVQHLPPAVIAAAREIAAWADKLTDGVPEESVPAGASTHAEPLADPAQETLPDATV